MKKLIVIALIAFVGCSKSNEEKAKSTVEAYLKKNLNDPSSYQPASWGTLKRAYAWGRFADSLHRYQDSSALYHKMDLQAIEADQMVMSLEYERKKSYFDNYAKQFYNMSDTTKPEGWKLLHSYRGKNAMNALIVKEEVFVLNEGLDSVLNIDK